MVFQGGFMNFHGFWLVSMGFEVVSWKINFAADVSFSILVFDVFASK